MVGSVANDVLAGGGGSDLLIGGAGDDDIMGDHDWIPDNFNWTITEQPDGVRIFEPVSGTDAPADSAADVIYAGAGNDHAWGGQGNDVIFAEDGNDYIGGNEGNDTILGGVGDDRMWGGAGNDYLAGGDDADEMQGEAGDDTLIGGKGIDTLYGGAGRDTYIINRGDGRDILIDTLSDNNIIRFGNGINSSDVTLQLGSLMLDLGGGDGVHIEGFNQMDVFNSSSIGGFEFADGTVLTASEQLARGFDLVGTANDDTITGTNTTDRINGLDGNDTLVGAAGNDILNGGAGDDVLDGDASDIDVSLHGDDTLDGGEVVQKRHIDSSVRIGSMAKKNFLRHLTSTVRKSSRAANDARYVNSFKRSAA